MTRQGGACPKLTVLPLSIPSQKLLRLKRSGVIIAPIRLYLLVIADKRLNDYSLVIASAKKGQTTMLTPFQVSEALQVPGSTVRRWALRFEKHLSQRTGKKRNYTMSDLDTFRRIRDLSASGFGLDRIDSMLEVVERPQDPSTALVSLADIAQALEAVNSKNAFLEQHLDQQTKRLDALTAWITLPWWKRLFQQMPK